MRDAERYSMGSRGKRKEWEITRKGMNKKRKKRIVRKGLTEEQ